VALPGQIAQTVWRPEEFAAAMTLVTRPACDVGINEVYVHQIGSDMDGFFAAYDRAVLPQLRHEHPLQALRVAPMVTSRIDSIGGLFRAFYNAFQPHCRERAGCRRVMNFRCSHPTSPRRLPRSDAGDAHRLAAVPQWVPGDIGGEICHLAPASVLANSLIMVSQNAGRSSGRRLEVRLSLMTTSWSTTLAPALRRSVRTLGHDVNVRPRATPELMSVQGP
jgi:hypothetical protein